MIAFNKNAGIVEQAQAVCPGVDQIRRYHRETPELFVAQQLFTTTDAIGFSYGVSWNTVRRNIFSWKCEPHGHLLEPQISHMGTDEETQKENLRHLRLKNQNDRLLTERLILGS